jgi:hypothetical protein
LHRQCGRSAGNGDHILDDPRGATDAVDKIVTELAETGRLSPCAIWARI